MIKLLFTMLLALTLSASATAQDEPNPITPAPTITVTQEQNGYCLVEITHEDPEAIIFYYFERSYFNEVDYSEWYEYTGPVIFSEPGYYVVRAYAVVLGMSPSYEVDIPFNVDAYKGTIAPLAYAHLIDEQNGLKVHFIANVHEYDLVAIPPSDEQYTWPEYCYYQINGTGEWQRIDIGDYIYLPDYGDYTIELYGCADGYSNSRMMTAVVHYDPDNYYSVCENDIVYNGLVYITDSDGTAKVAPQYYAPLTPHFYIEYEGNVVIPQVLSIEGENYTVTSISNEAFGWHSSITGLSIPKTVTSIGEDIFYNGCSCLTLNVEDGNPVYDSRDNCNAIIETATNKLIQGCVNTFIPNTVTTIGKKALMYADIVNIDIPNSVTTIEDQAFYACHLLESVSIANSVTSFGKRVFTDCSSLTNVNIPNSLTKISEYTFMHCNNLKDIDIPNSITAIEYGAFYGCSSLNNVIIPNSVSEIGPSAYMMCTSLTSISIPEGVATIERGTFQGCSNLASVTIPGTVTSIGSLALAACDNLTRITCHAETPPSVHSQTFDYNSNAEALYEQATLFVPNESVEAYRAHEEWGKFMRIVPFIGAGPGDINGDGNIAIGDVTNLIDMLLAGEELPAYVDVNGDGMVTIADVAALIDMLLGGN